MGLTMVRNSTADLPEFAKGVAAVLSHLPGVALLSDARGDVIFGNSLYFDDAPPTFADKARPTVPAALLADVLGTDQTAYHSLVLPSGRRTGVSCQRIQDPHDGTQFIVIREDSREAIVAKFAAANEGLLRSGIERERARATEERLKAEACHWRMMSQSDSLTGLLNAAGFRDHVQHALRTCDFGALVYADLNGFKVVNDTLGHLAGDELMKDIGHALHVTVRKGDIAGRVGGDEFAVFLPDCPAEELLKVIARMRKAMTRRIPVAGQGANTSRLLSVTPAIGSAVFPEDHSGLDDLLRLADARMYADKSGDRLRRGQAGA